MRASTSEPNMCKRASLERGLLPERWDDRLASLSSLTRLRLAHNGFAIDGGVSRSEVDLELVLVVLELGERSTSASSSFKGWI